MSYEEDIIKDVNRIPPGHYCYTKRDGMCPFWEETKSGAFCHFLNQHHEEGCYVHLVWDKVKCCQHIVDKIKQGDVYKTEEPTIPSFIPYDLFLGVSTIDTTPSNNNLSLCPCGMVIELTTYKKK